MEPPADATGSAPDSMERRHSLLGSRPVIYFLFAFVLYVLSTGPVAQLEGHCAIPRYTVKTLYAPLFFLSDRSDTLNRLFEWYTVSVWGAAG